MSLATRCTACGTIFRVVQDQLKVSEGWVRCGRCQEVFNALESLFDLEREAPPQRQAHAPSATEVAQRAVEEFIASGHPPLNPDLEARLPATQEEDAIESRFLARPSAGDRRLADADEDEEDEAGDPAHPDFVDARFPSELPLDAAADEEQTAVAESPPAATEPARPEPRPPLRQRLRERRAHREREAISSLFETSTGDLPDPGRSTAALYELTPGTAPSFVRQAENAERWRRPRVRASLVVAGLLLLGTLAVQVAVQFRDNFAALRPEARPALQALCEVMGCSIGPPRQLAAVSVEASGLTEVEGSEIYRLSLILNNRAGVAVAAPAIELGLTDGSGALIARRTLLPGDFHTAAGAAVVGSAPLAARTETQWQALLNAGGEPISGYTIELFYP